MHAWMPAPLIGPPTGIVVLVVVGVVVVLLVVTGRVVAVAGVVATVERVVVGGRGKVVGTVVASVVAGSTSRPGRASAASSVRSSAAPWDDGCPSANAARTLEKTRTATAVASGPTTPARRSLIIRPLWAGDPLGWSAVGPVGLDLG